MATLKTADLINLIEKLGTEKSYLYFSKATRLRITEIHKPEGPIRFKRWSNNESEKTAKSGGISTNQLAIVSTVFSGKPNYPIHFDRLFSAGGNSRAALETLLAYTPNFFICYPQKTNPYTGKSEAKLKHIMWCPDDEHPWGQIQEKHYDQIISEVELGIDFGDINVTPGMLGKEFDTIEAKKTHTQMQVALVKIGNALNFRTWIARNDRSIPIGGTKLGSIEGVIPSLDDVQILYNQEIKQAASLIDCIWFTNDFKYIPAVIEVEHSTGVTSGLTRMLKFRETIPSTSTTYTVVAPNELRNKVVTEANNLAFRPIKPHFMPYSTVRELYGLLQKYRLANLITRNFIEPFMESVVE
jgi:type II restriction enzyme